MANGHGGRRAGAGRKPKSETFKSQISEADQYTAEQLRKNAETMQRLADGGLEEIQETWEPAGTVLIDDIEVSEDETSRKVVKVKRLAFPDKKPDELVLVQRKVIVRGPDRAALEYLIGRIAGTPRRDEEPDERDAAIEQFRQAVLEAIAEADDATQKKIIRRLRRGAVGQPRRRPPTR